LAADMREIWMMQPRFDKRVGATPFSLVEHLRFRAGFDFLRLRADVSEVDISLADWWQEFSMADQSTREDLVAQLREQQRAQPKPKVEKSFDKPPAPASRAPRNVDAQIPPDGSLAEDESGDDSGPKKRRRRRGPRRDGGSGAPIES
jgi:poly(A) polymerase